MARTKTTANPPPPSVSYKPLYPWASDELLAETSTLTSFANWRAHLDSEPDFKGRAFGREHDFYISVRPCTAGEPVCVDNCSNDGDSFFFFYQTVLLGFVMFLIMLLLLLNIAIINCFNWFKFEVC